MMMLLQLWIDLEAKCTRNTAGVGENRRLTGRCLPWARSPAFRRENLQGAKSWGRRCRCFHVA